jgi:DnaK suppressor protein
MTKNEDIAKSLKTRLSELTGRVAEIESELRKPLSADSEERATDLENQDALVSIKNSEIQEIRQVQGALKRIAEGTYGVCVQCGADIDPKRLKALPIAARCISCVA